MALLGCLQALAALSTAVALCDSAATAAGTSARADPSIVAAGESLNLIFSVASPELLEVVLQGRVQCTVKSPSGTSTQVCDRPGALVDVRLVGQDQREYVFQINAPRELGTYEVQFQVASTLTVLPATYEATTSYRVVPPDQVPTRPTDGSPGGNPPGPGSTQGPPGDSGRTKEGGGDDGGSGLASAGADAARWFVSSTLAAGVTTVTVVARRWRFGGLP